MTVASIRRILVVHDDARMQKLIEDILVGMPVEYESISDPMEVLERLETGSFDLVISDVRMPKIDGMELVSEIRRKHPLTDCIIITAHPESHSCGEILDAGASDFIIKPFSAAELIAKISRIDRERSMRRRLEQANAAIEWESAVNAVLADLARSLLSSASLEEISKFVQEHGRRLTRSRLGCVGYIDRNTGRLVCPAMTKEVWEQCRVPGKDVTVEKFSGLWGWVIHNRLPLLCNAPEQDTRFRGTPPGHVEIRSFLCVPVVSGEELVGQIAFANKSGEYDEQDLALLERLAEIYAVAIERANDQQEIDQYEFHVEELVEQRTHDLIETNRQLQKSERRAHELSDRVLQMLMIMSHDIRGPLVSMGAILKLLLRDTYGKMDESVKNTILELMSRTTNLVRIAEDCLSKAHAAGNTGDDELELLDLRQDVIDVVLDELADDIETHQIRIDNRLGGIPAGLIRVRGSRVWLKAIYRNLFGNAIKHGGHGCTIAFGFEDRGSHFRLNIYNTGKPIPEEKRDRLFTRFGRVGNSECGVVDGAGLGLYLIRENIRKLGGDIWYEARPGGSDFVFTIPKQWSGAEQGME